VKAAKVEQGISEIVESLMAGEAAAKEVALRERIAKADHERRTHVANLTADLFRYLPELEAATKARKEAQEAFEKASQHPTYRRFMNAQRIANQHGYGHGWQLWAQWFTSDHNGVGRRVYEFMPVQWVDATRFDEGKDRAVVRDVLNLQIAAKIAAAHEADCHHKVSRILDELPALREYIKAAG
jgi:hypothetical protein